MLVTLQPLQLFHGGISSMIPNLVSLIDTALQHNQEMMIVMQEIEIAKNDVRFRQGRLSPTVGARLGLGVEKVGRYTSQGAGDASTEISPGKEVPDPLTDMTAVVFANWEVDIWNKLHNAKKAAITRYLSSVEGKNFLRTNLISEVANSYYELLALDNQLEIIRQNILLQQNALEVVKLQKDAARVTELAVQKFQASVLNTQSLGVWHPSADQRDREQDQFSSSTIPPGYSKK
jgi:outer membrane protein TolC